MMKKDFRDDLQFIWPALSIPNYIYVPFSFFNTKIDNSYLMCLIFTVYIFNIVGYLHFLG